ncbi:hypothetical protein OG836_13540 [Micromonospora zamorensis]|uniref:hypothetical protein n=1 Tax=Micromonospora zamorensis TaxID=709883 RepID=UPI002E22807C
MRIFWTPETPQAVVRALELDDHEMPGLVYGEQVDPAPGFLPVAELLGHDQTIGAEHGNVVPEESLQVLALVEPEGGEPGRVVPPQVSRTVACRLASPRMVHR